MGVYIPIYPRRYAPGVIPVWGLRNDQSIPRGDDVVAANDLCCRRVCVQCDVTCGGGGTQRRIVHCQLPSGRVLPDRNCPDFAVPPNSRPCGLEPCPARDAPTSTPSPSSVSISARWRKSRWSPVSPVRLLCYLESSATTG